MGWVIMSERELNRVEAGNAYLQGFKERHNAKFAKPPAKSDNLHRTLNVEPDRLADVLCWRENQFGTLTISDNPPFFGDVLASRAFEEIVREVGIAAFYNKKERRKLGL